MMEKLCTKTAPKKLKFLWLKCSQKPEAGTVVFLVRLSSEAVWPLQYQSMFPMKFHCSFMGNKLWCGCSPVNLLLIFGRHFCRNIYGGLHLIIGVKLSYRIWKLNCKLILFSLRVFYRNCTVLKYDFILGSNVSLIFTILTK